MAKDRQEGRQKTGVDEMEGGAILEAEGTRADQIKGGAREKTGGSRRSQVGPRSQPGWRPMVELTEGGAMVEEGLTAPGGRRDGGTRRSQRSGVPRRRMVDN